MRYILAFRLSAKEEVLAVLRRFGVDESAIEAEAIRGASADLAMVDRMLTLLEARRNKALRSVARYREDLAKRLAHRSDLLIEQDGAAQLAHQSG